MIVGWIKAAGIVSIFEITFSFIIIALEQSTMASLDLASTR